MEKGDSRAKVAVLTTHPIQYQAPLFSRLGSEFGDNFEVWFLSKHGLEKSVDREFGREFAWDIDLLAGYRSFFLATNNDSSMDIRKPWSLRLAQPLGPLIRERGIGRLWLLGWQKAAFWQARRQARREGVQLWLRGETNNMRGERGARWWLKSLLLRWYFSGISKFFCIGSANRAFYSRLGVPQARMLSAPYFVDNKRFETAASALHPHRIELRRRWGVPDDAACILFCGKLVGKKRPLDLADACSMLWRRSPTIRGRPIHFLVVGTGVLESVLRERVDVRFAAGGRATRKPGVVPASVVGFLNQSEIAGAYVASDVLALPSDAGETWGLVVNEAMACGCVPVVSDKVGCGPDLVAPLGARLVYPCGNVEALASALEEALFDPPSATSIRSVVESCSMEKTVDAFRAAIGSSETASYHGHP